MANQYDLWPGGITYTLNVTYTQANAAGGAVVCEITPGEGNEFIVLAAEGINSGTNTVVMDLETATGGTKITRYTSIASGAGTTGYLGGTTTSAPPVVPIPPPGLLVSGTQAFKVAQTGAGAQNDTFQVLLNVRCKNGLPTVIHSNSTNAANVSATAGSETMTPVG